MNSFNAGQVAGRLAGSWGSVEKNGVWTSKRLGNDLGTKSKRLKQTSEVWSGDGLSLRLATTACHDDRTWRTEEHWKGLRSTNWFPVKRCTWEVKTATLACLPSGPPLTTEQLNRANGWSTFSRLEELTGKVCGREGDMLSRKWSVS